MRYAVKLAKNNKAVGPNEIAVEVIKLIRGDTIQILVDLFNAVYQSGDIPTKWLKSTFVAIRQLKLPY